MVERRKMILCWRLPWIHRRRIVPRLPGPATARILSVLRQNGDQSFSKTQHPSTAPKTVPVQCIIRCRSVFFFVFFFFWRNYSATAGLIFTKLSPIDVFAVLFVDGGITMKIGLPKFMGPKTFIAERKFRLRRFWTSGARKRGGILGKLKQLV